MQEVRDEDFTELQDENYTLKQEIKDLKKKQRTQSQPEIAKASKSTKIPDPSVFTDNNNPT